MQKSVPTHIGIKLTQLKINVLINSQQQRYE